MPPDGNMTGAVYLLDEIAARTAMLDVACNCCSRRGRLSMARLLAEHGEATPGTVVLAQLIATCREVKSGQLYDRCGAHFPQLPVLFP
jgi:hypothetical protein